MARKLSQLYYDGCHYFVDFRLEEIRPIDRPFDPIRFNEIKDEVLIRMIRNLRFITGVLEFHKGIY